jgi:Calcineurin-like phosphoesterase
MTLDRSQHRLKMVEEVPSLAHFKDLVFQNLKEIVCPYKSTFGKQRRGLRNERVVSYWAQYQAEQIYAMIEDPHPILSVEHLRRVFHMFRVVCYQDLTENSASSSSSHGGASESNGNADGEENQSCWYPEPLPAQKDAFFSMPIDIFPEHMSAIRPLDNVFWIEKECFTLPPRRAGDAAVALTSPADAEIVEKCRSKDSMSEAAAASSSSSSSSKQQTSAPAIVGEERQQQQECGGNAESINDSSGLQSLGSQDGNDVDEADVEKKKKKKSNAKRDGAKRGGSYLKNDDADGDGSSSPSPPPRDESVNEVLFERYGIKLTLWGDIHGSAHSLLRTVADFVDADSWHISDPHRYFIFLGDYMDRGAYSLETLYVLLRLKIDNPKQVFLLRGDHEMHTMNITNHFIKEMLAKYPSDGRSIVEDIGQLYSYMPVALWLSFCENVLSSNSSSSSPPQNVRIVVDSSGSNVAASSSTSALDQRASDGDVAEENDNDDDDDDDDASSTINMIQFCHGGMELGIECRDFLAQDVSKRFHLLERMSRRAHAKNFKFRRPSDRQGLMENDLTYNGFMWSDFCLNRLVETLSFNPGRGYVYSKPATEYILSEYATPGRSVIRAVFRGHQHSIDQGILFHLINKEGVLGIWTDRKNKAHTRAKRADDSFDEQPHVVNFDLQSGNLVYTLLSAPSSSLLFAVDNYVNVTIPSANFSHWRMHQIARQIEASSA